MNKPADYNPCLAYSGIASPTLHSVLLNGTRVDYLLHCNTEVLQPKFIDAAHNRTFANQLHIFSDMNLHFASPVCPALVHSEHPNDNGARNHGPLAPGPYKKIPATGRHIAVLAGMVTGQQAFHFQAYETAFDVVAWTLWMKIDSIKTTTISLGLESRAV